MCPGLTTYETAPEFPTPLNVPRQKSGNVRLTFVVQVKMPGHRATERQRQRTGRAADKEAIMGKALTRSTLSPIVGLTFTVVVITGILALLRLGGHTTMSFHQWAGVVFAVAATLHLAANWRTFLNYLKKNTRKSVTVSAVIAVALLLTTALFDTSGCQEDGPRFERRGNSGWHRNR